MSPKDRQTQMRAATADVIAWQDHGDTKARARAIQSVEDMVCIHAAAAHRRIGHRGVAIEDLRAAGRLGAVIATDRFDRTRGTDYASAASPWIRDQVQQTARHSAGVVAPPNSSPSRSAEAAIRRALTVGRTIEEAAVIAGINVSEAQALVGRTQPVSFDLEAHASSIDPDPIEGLQSSTSARLLSDAMSVLDAREMAIVRARSEEQPFTTIGPAHGITPERAGQIYQVAMGKMRAFLRERGLRLDDLL